MSEQIEHLQSVLWVIAKGQGPCGGLTAEQMSQMAAEAIAINHPFSGSDMACEVCDKSLSHPNHAGTEI